MLLVVSYAMGKFKLFLGIDQKTYVKCVSNTGNSICAKLSEKQNFFPCPLLIRTCTCSFQGVRNDTFVESIRKKWMIPYVFRTL